MFSFSTMILECCCFASIFVASFVETNDALALPLFTHSFLSLSLSENALVEKWVFVMRVVRIYLPRIKYAQATTTPPDPQRDDTWREVFEFFLKTKIHFLDFLFVETPLCFLKFFLFAVLFHLVPTHFWRTFARVCSYPKKRRRSRERTGFFSSHKL